MELKVVSTAWLHCLLLLKYCCSHAVKWNVCKCGLIPVCLKEKVMERTNGFTTLYPEGIKPLFSFKNCLSCFRILLANKNQLGAAFEELCLDDESSIESSLKLLQHLSSCYHQTQKGEQLAAGNVFR